MSKKTITATLVKESERSSFLYDHFGGALMLVENSVYTTLSRICADYNGGYWEFVELSNGGAYMQLSTSQDEFNVVCRNNYYEGKMSPDAASIVACLYAINAAVWDRPDDENLNKHYYWLRDFAAEHEEVAAIFGAID